MDSNNNEIPVTTSQESKDIGIAKETKYYPASESCETLDTVVPLAMAYEQKRFNQGLSISIQQIYNMGVAEFVMDRLKYTTIKDFCDSFGKEQIDAIATAIWNFENTGNGIIVSDQTGVGKGRIGAGLIRYCILHLGKVPIFFTEKKHLINDMYRDLIDIKLDCGIKEYIKVSVSSADKDLTDDEIIKKIKEDIKENEELRIEYDFEKEDFNLDTLFITENSELLSIIIELYRQYFELNTEDFELIKNPNYKQELAVALSKGRKLIKPFVPIGNFDIKDKDGGILYRLESNTVNEVLGNKKRKLPSEYKLICLPYSQIQKPFKSREEGVYTDKNLFIQAQANNTLLILDESHSASGYASATGMVIKTMIENAKDVVYISATYSKRPDNMPLYSLKTSIREANLSYVQLTEAYHRGDVALQEATTSELVKIGQLVRRQKLIQGKTEYIPKNIDEFIETELGKEQIAKLQRISELFLIVREFSAKVKENFRMNVLREYGKEESKKYKFAGNTERFSFLLFNFFILGLKVKQTVAESLTELQNGRKVIIAIANTLESAFDNLKKDFLNDVKYELGDFVENDFRFYCAYLLNYTLRYTYEKDEIKLDSKGKETIIINKELFLIKEKKNDLSKILYNDLIGTFEDKLSLILNLVSGVPIAPIDVISDLITKQGFRVDEITCRSRKLEFIDGDYTKGRLEKRKKRKIDDIIRDFNENKLDCLIINQAGAVGVSMHSVPTKNSDGKIVPPVDKIVGDFFNPPKSLKPDDEVKARTMIITQMELDINKEVQKIGRINRTGMVYAPHYKYIVSAVPSESRLTAIMEKKLRSLSANVNADQTQFADQFTADNFFSEIAVKPFNKTMEEIGDSERASDKEEISAYTKKMYFANFNVQKDFYDTFSKNLKIHIEFLISQGNFTGAMAIKDYDAILKDTKIFMIGDNNSISSFGSHIFIEEYDCIVFTKKILEDDISLSIKTKFDSDDVYGNPVVFETKDEYLNYFSDRIKKTLDDFESSRATEVGYQEKLIIGYNSTIDLLNADAIKFLGLPEALLLESAIKENNEILDEKNKSVIKLIGLGKMDEVNVLSIEIQALAKTISNLDTKLRNNPDSEYILSNQKEEGRIAKKIENNKNYIEDANNEIKKQNNSYQEQVSISSLIIKYINLIGNILDYKTFDESWDSDSNKYIYSTLQDKKVVLTGVKYKRSWNQTFTTGGIMLYFSDAIETFSQSSFDIEQTFSEEEVLEEKKVTTILNNTNSNYKDVWNEYVKTVNTGKRVNKMILTGSLLKAFSVLGFGSGSGNIVKFNTSDKILKLGIELNDSTQITLQNVFSSGNYQVMFSLTEENYNKLILDAFYSLSKEKDSNYFNIRGFANQIIFSKSITSIINTRFNNDLYMGTDFSNITASEFVSCIEIEFVSNKLSFTKYIQGMLQLLEIEYDYKNYTNKDLKDIDDAILYKNASGNREVYYGSYQLNESVFLSSVDLINEFSSGNKILGGSQTKGLGIKISLDGLYKLIEYMKKENVLFTSVTSNEIVEKNNDFYVFEKRNDLVLAIDNEGSETTIKEFTDATTEATLDSLIDRLVESLK